MPVESGLVDAKDLWRLTMDVSPVGMAILSPDGNYLLVNRALCQMLGYEAEVLTSLTYQSLTHPDDLDPHVPTMQRLFAGELPSLRLTKRWVRSDGSILLGDLSLAVMRDALGAPSHVIAQIVDLSERRMLETLLSSTEEQLESAQAQVQAVFDAAHVGLLLFDRDGIVVRTNQRQDEFMALAFPEGHRGQPGQPGFVYTADQSRLLGSSELPSTRASEDEPLQDVLVWIGEHPEKRRALSVTMRPVLSASGARSGTAVACLDVTDLVQARRAKEEFVATAAHELRTPLAAVLANLELLEDDPGVTPDVESHLDAVRRNAWRLSRLVADLIYAARISAGGQVVDPYQVDLAALLREAIAGAEKDAAAKRITLSTVMPDAVVVDADGLRVRHAMDNLLAHAIVTCPRQGEVAVKVTLDDEAVTIDVRHDEDENDAAGQRADHLFLLDDHLAEPRTGGDLGLSLVRTIAEGHGGAVTLHTDAGGTTTVRVVLPR